MQKKSLIGKTLSQLKEIVNSLGLPTFTAKQIAEWIYKKRVLCIDEMTNISLKNRELLNDQYQVGRYLPIEQTISIDGTKKYLFGTTSDFFIETVYNYSCSRQIDIFNLYIAFYCFWIISHIC